MRFLDAAPMPDIDVDGDDTLQGENQLLREQLRTAQRELAAAKRESARALGELRRQLGPLYKALQMVFGELDAAGVDEAPAASGPVNTRTAAVWESWKNKLGVGAAKCIDALLLHGEMNTNQLSIATGYHRNTVPQYVSKLNTAGLINKNGGRFSLKSL